jgi:endonuclease III
MALEQVVSKIMDTLEEQYVSKKQLTIRRNSIESKSPFKILISCLLSLRTTDANTKRASEKLFAVVNTFEELVKISIEELEKLIFSSGHYHKKARTLKHVSNEILQRFNGKVPKTREELMSIKGIGPKTANIVLAFAFDKEVLPIDTHCHRIPNRLGWVNTKTPEKTEMALYKILPKRYWKEFNTVIILFGKDICKPISPWCSKCPVKNYCKRNNIGKSR